jgi:hypothetical protein
MPDVWERYVCVVAGGKVCPSESKRFNATVRNLEGKRIELAIREEVTGRSLDQNAYLHVLAKLIAKESGETLDRVKRLAVLESLGIEAGTEKETILGREITIVRRTSELRKDEASKLIDWMLDKCSFLGVTPPSREQVEALG